VEVKGLMEEMLCVQRLTRQSY